MGMAVPRAITYVPSAPSVVAPQSYVGSKRFLINGSRAVATKPNLRASSPITSRRERKVSSKALTSADMQKVVCGLQYVEYTVPSRRVVQASPPTDPQTLQLSTADPQALVWGLQYVN